MKGITATAVLLALLAGLTANLTVQAAPPTQAAGITFSITDPATGLSVAEGEAGTDLSMLVSTQGTDNMQGIQLALRYDPEVVTVASVVSGQVPQNFLFMANKTVPGVVKIALVGFGAAGVSEIDLATITFDLTPGSPGDSTVLAFENIIAADASTPPKPIPVEAVDGSIRIITPPVAVDIDIKPGNDLNSIDCNKQKDIIPVAILTTGAFDATTVDHSTVTFEGAIETHGNEKRPVRHEKDVDGDGDTDLLLHFRLGDTALTCHSTEGILRGETLDGQAIQGGDTVRMEG